MTERCNRVVRPTPTEGALGTRIERPARVQYEARAGGVATSGFGTRLALLARVRALWAWAEVAGQGLVFVA